LPTALCVERRALENDGAFGVFVERLHGLPCRIEQQNDGRLGRERLVSQELRLALDFHAGGEVGAELARGLRLPPLHVHGALVALRVHGQAALTRDVGREIGREPVGIVKLEDRVAVDDLRAAELRDGGVENRHAGL